MKEFYYCNKPCRLIADLSNDESIIEICLGAHSYSGGGYEPDSFEPEFQTIIVNKKYISENKIDLEKDLKKYSDALKLKEQESLKKLREAEQDAKIKVDNIIKQTKKYEGLSQMLDYLDGSIEYVVYTEDYGNIGIKKLSEVGSNYEKELCAVSFRSKRAQSIHGAFRMYIQEYSDSSGQKYSVVGFKTLDEAKSHFISLIPKLIKDNRTYHLIIECDKWNIKLDVVEDIRKRNQEESNERKQKEIDALKAKLESLGG